MQLLIVVAVVAAAADVAVAVSVMSKASRPWHRRDLLSDNLTQHSMRDTNASSATYRQTLPQPGKQRQLNHSNSNSDAYNAGLCDIQRIMLRHTQHTARRERYDRMRRRMHTRQRPRTRYPARRAPINRRCGNVRRYCALACDTAIENGNNGGGWWWWLGEDRGQAERELGRSGW